MFYQFRPIQAKEFFVVAGDGAQGGSDWNYCHFISKTKKDIPLVYRRHGVMAEMTNDIYPVLERIAEVTGIAPVVAFERNNGGASEMKRLYDWNRKKLYVCYTMKSDGKTDEKETDRLGYETTGITRPKIVGDLRLAVGSRLYRIYDEETVKQLNTFIVNKQGKPEAAKGMKDDAVMALAVGHQLFLEAEPYVLSEVAQQPKPDWASGTPSWSGQSWR
jgi:hypothetical protein